MLIVAAVLALLAVTTVPSLWVRWTLQRHAADREDFPGTGGELARHLLNRYDLPGVAVERSDGGDHYDPVAKAVRLTPAHFDGRSVAAVAVATHEVGHALQDAGGDRFLLLRQRLAALASVTDKLAGVFFLASPVFGVLARTPLAFGALVAVGVALLSVRVVATLVTLPVEFDASFRKAMPILSDGNYLHEADLPAARSVLRAAALTYLAAALISLVNLARWIRLLR